jgi:hypothetical protein
MKLTTFTTALRNHTLKMLAGAALAGAILTAAPAAQAQRIVFGVGFHGPRYFRPAPPVIFYGPGFYGPDYYRFHRDWRFRHEYRRDWR